MTRIEIVVDELVLRGLDPSQARAAAAALEARLGELASRHDGPVAPREEASRRLAAVEAESPAAIGTAAAGSVWTTIAGGAR